MAVAGTLAVPAEVFGIVEGIRITEAKIVPFALVFGAASKLAIPGGGRVVPWGPATVTVNFTAPELSTLEGVSDREVVVAEAVAVAKV